MLVRKADPRCWMLVRANPRTLQDRPRNSSKLRLSFTRIQDQGSRISSSYPGSRIKDLVSSRASTHELRYEFRHRQTSFEPPHAPASYALRITYSASALFPPKNLDFHGAPHYNWILYNAPSKNNPKGGLCYAQADQAVRQPASL